MRKPRPILLAEDSPNDVELTLMALSDVCRLNEIVVVNDGVAALDFLHRRGEFAGRTSLMPSVVILDLKMPKVGGLEVLRQVRTNPSLALTPVVIFTSSREDDDLLEGYNLGANAYVVKPVGFENFIAAVGQLGIFWTTINEPVPDASE
jgi:CheY-like chemotaxis protein